jgi:hypothetical protein
MKKTNSAGLQKLHLEVIFVEKKSSRLKIVPQLMVEISDGSAGRA